MKTSDNGLNALKGREGARNIAYQDVKGIWTIGVGHTGPEVVEGLQWTDEQILAQLAIDVGVAENAVNEATNVELTQNEFDALVSFTFNVGGHAFAQSTMCKLINHGDFDGATTQFPRWNIPQEIIGRRLSEQAQFATPDTPAT